MKTRKELILDAMGRSLLWACTLWAIFITLYCCVGLFEKWENEVAMGVAYAKPSDPLWEVVATFLFIVVWTSPLPIGAAIACFPAFLWIKRKPACPRRWTLLGAGGGYLLGLPFGWSAPTLGFFLGSLLGYAVDGFRKWRKP